MADKKITDLTLISSVTDGLNIPCDNGIQSYRATAAQIKAFVLAAENVGLSSLALDIFNGLTQVTPEQADFVPLIDNSDSGNTKKISFGALINSTYRAISGATTLTGTDEIVSISGASANITLPATGNSGRRIKLIHNGTSLSQVYTLVTGGADIVGINTVSSGDYKLFTKGEMLEVLDDGTDWIVIDKNTESAWFSYTPSFTGWGTPININFQAKRKGQDVDIKGVFEISGSTSAVVGSIGFPTGLSASTDHSTNQILGELYEDAAQNYTYQLLATGGDTGFRFGTHAGSGGAMNSQLVNTYWTTGDLAHLIANVKMQELQP